jgi:hypothetical protein
MRFTLEDEERIRGELLRARRRAYEDELTIQARRVGCATRRGRLGNNATLTALNEQSRLDAVSIANTYNYDLAIAIQHIRTETPTANRHVYARRLSDWEAKRNRWKSKQIAEWTEGTARAAAQQDFHKYNKLLGTALLAPTRAVCPICQGWIRRGEVAIQVALNNPPPYHRRCPHVWNLMPGKVAADECSSLWMGE